MEIKNSAIYRSLSLLCFNLFIASLILVASSYFSLLILDVIVNPDVLFGVGMFLGFLALVFWENSKGKWKVDFHKGKLIAQESRKDDNLFFRVVPYLFLLMLLIIAINQFWKNPFINAQMMRITILAITFGAVTFWRNRDRVENEIEKEKEDEEKSEAKRYAEFDKKFPGISRIWGLKHFVRWMYKEGWWYSGALIGIVVLGAWVVLYKLGNYSFQVDEIYHALVAKNMLESPFTISAGFLYLRAGIVSILAFLSGFILPFLSKEFAYRLPIALFGIINIFLMYILSKKIIGSKLISLILSASFAFDLFFIIFSRYLRFYTLAITLILIIFILLIKNNFDKYWVLFSFFISLFFSLFLNEFFIFLAAIFFLIYFIIRSEKAIDYKIFIFGLLLVIALGVYLYISSVANASFLTNVLNYHLTSRMVQLHLVWLMNVYPLVVISFVFIICSLFSKNNNIKWISRIVTLIYLIIFLFIDMTNYNFTIRLFLFVLPINLVLLFYFLVICTPNRYILKIFLVLVVLLPLIITSFISVPRSYGDPFEQNKFLYEKQPVILDTESVILFHNSLIKNSSRNVSTIYVSLSDLYFLYYANKSPDYLVRWEGSSLNKVSQINTSMLFNLSELIDKLEELQKEKTDVVVITYGTIYPVDNSLYGLLYNKVPLEADGNIGIFLENSGKKIYTGRDNLSSVYFFGSE